MTRYNSAEELHMLKRRKKVKREREIALFKFAYFKLCSVPRAPFYYISETTASGLPNTSLPKEISRLFPLHYTRGQKMNLSSIPSRWIFFLQWENEV